MNLNKKLVKFAVAGSIAMVFSACSGENTPAAPSFTPNAATPGVQDPAQDPAADPAQDPTTEPAAETPTTDPATQVPTTDPTAQTPVADPNAPICNEEQICYYPENGKYVDMKTGTILNPDVPATTPTDPAATTPTTPTTPASSSSTVTKPASSSSTVTKPASSSSTATKPATSDAGFALWDGTAGDTQIPTGDAKAGYWYSYDDAGSKGKSTIKWAAEAGDEYSETSVAPVIKECGGLEGSFTLVQGGNEYDPFVGVGFDLVMEGTVDYSSYGGMCVEYTSSVDIKVEIGFGADGDEEIGYANPTATLPAQSTAAAVDLAWSKFGPPWTGATKVASPEKKMAALKFKFAGSDGDTGTFKITKVGPKGTCK